MEKREQDLLYKIEVGSENVVVPDSLKPENMKKKLETVCVGRTQEKKTADSGSLCGLRQQRYCIGGRNHSIPESDENGKIGFCCDKQR